MTEPTNPKPEKTRACPVCGEQIKTVAKKCVHCNEFLDGPAGWHWAGWLALRPRTVWDLTGLLVIPIALAVCGLSFNFYQDVRQERINATVRSENRATDEFLYHERKLNDLSTREARSAEKTAVAVHAAQTSEALTERNKIAQTKQAYNAQATIDALNAAQAIQAATEEEKAAAQAIATAQSASSQATAQAAKIKATTDAVHAAQTAVAVQAAQTTEAISADDIRAAEARATTDAIDAAQSVSVAQGNDDKATAEAAVIVRATEAVASAQTAEALATAEAADGTATAQAVEAIAAVDATITAQAEQTAAAEATATTAPAVEAVEAAETCTYEGPVKTSWENHKERLGCAKETRTPPYAWQPFVNAHVFWSDPLDMYVVANNDGSWRRVFGTGLPDLNPICPEEALPAPLTEAMRRLWCSNKDVLGPPQLGEQNGDIAFQDFDNGLVWINEMRGELYTFFEDDSSYVGPE